jgi:hypothetical protein
MRSTRAAFCKAIGPFNKQVSFSKQVSKRGCMNRFWITGLVPATFTPMHDDGSLNLAQVGAIVDHLVARDVNALFACGSTGESASMTTAERQATLEAYCTAAAGRIPIIAHVGHTALADARALAAHAQQTGAAAIAALPPFYFKPATVATLVACMAEIAAAAPDLPFYYYHIPGLTGVNLDMVEFLRQGEQRIPTLAGIKYSSPTLYEFQACANYAGGRFNLLFGVCRAPLPGDPAGFCSRRDGRGPAAATALGADGAQGDRQLSPVARSQDDDGLCRCGMWPGSSAPCGAHARRKRGAPRRSGGDGLSGMAALESDEYHE